MANGQNGKIQITSKLVIRLFWPAKTRNYEISRIKTAEKRNLTYQFLYQDRTYRVDFNPKKTELMTLELHFISYLVAPVR